VGIFTFAFTCPDQSRGARRGARLTQRDEILSVNYRRRTKRAANFTSSPLDDVPGIGPSRKKALLMHFGTAKAVRGATLEDLERAPGVSKTMARAIHDYFHAGG